MPPVDKSADVTDLQIRITNQSGDEQTGTVEFELRPALVGSRHVVFVLDFSDSCEGVIGQLLRLVPLGKLLPSNCPVALFALSSPEPLHVSSGMLYASDLEHYFHELQSSPDAIQWIKAFENRGSFIRPPLEGIARYLEAEQSIDSDRVQKALVFVVTDGELMDITSPEVPNRCTAIGILSESRTDRPSRWSDVLPECKAYGLNTSELFAAARRCISPAEQSYEIKATFSILKKGQSLQHSTSRGRPSRVLQWDFRKGNLELTAHRKVLNDRNAFIECQPRAGISTRLYVHGLTMELPSHLASVRAGGERATVRNGSFIVIEDSEIVEKLYEHFRSREKERLPWSADCVNLLYRSVSKLDRVGDNAGLSAFDAVLAVFLPLTPGQNDSKRRLAVGRLYRDKSKYLFMKPDDSAFEDPGFTVQKMIHVSYHEFEARWQLRHGESSENLDPHGSQCLATHFFDRDGIACDAFYSGKIDSSVFI